MLKKMAVAGLVLLVGSNLAFANDVKHKHHKHHRHHQKEQAAYKGEVATAQPMTVVAAPTNLFEPAYYLGASVGSRVNYVSKPSLYTGLEGTVFAGYGGAMDGKMYLAGELVLGSSATIQDYKNSTARYNVKSSWNLGLSLIPGYLLTDDVLGYLRAGIATTNFSSASSNVATGQLGLGMQAALCKNWDLRGEYIYSFYRSVSGTGSPRSQQFNLGLLYKYL